MEEGQGRRGGVAREGAARELGSRRFDDARMEEIMGRILQWGVLLASGVVLLGGVLYLVANHGDKPQYRSFDAGPNKLSVLHPGALVHGVAQGDAGAIIQVGLVLLIATPIARVVCAVVAFSLERDRLYVGVSLLVLAVLLWGMLRGG